MAYAERRAVSAFAGTPRSLPQQSLDLLNGSHTPFAEANFIRTTRFCGGFSAAEPAYTFVADDKPVVVSALHHHNPSLRSLDRTLEMGGRVWSMQ